MAQLQFDEKTGYKTYIGALRIKPESLDVINKMNIRWTIAVAHQKTGGHKFYRVAFLTQDQTHMMFSLIHQNFYVVA